MLRQNNEYNNRLNKNKIDLNDYHQLSLHLAIEQFKELPQEQETLKKYKQLKDELLLHLNTQLPTKPKDPIFHAFNNEYKCRWYVQSICEFVIKSYKKQYYLEMERKIPIFGYSKEM